MRGRSASWRLALALLLPAAVAGQPAEEGPLHLGVVTFYNARLMFVKYQPLVDHLSAKTGRPWILSVSTSYEATVEDLCAGRVALAYLGPLTYLRAHARCGAEPLLRLEGGGRAVFRSDILVRTDSPFERLEDLAGQQVGFGDPLSTSSHLVPRAMLQDAGLEVGRDFECRYFGQHEQAARAVLMGEVAACGVRDVIGELFLHRGLRRLARSGPVPAYPLVVAPGTPPDLRESLSSALRRVSGAPRPAGHEDRRDLDLSGGFVAAADTDYDPVRDLAEQVFGPGFPSLPEEELRCR